MPTAHHDIQQLAKQTEASYDDLREKIETLRDYHNKLAVVVERLAAVIEEEKPWLTQPPI